MPVKKTPSAKESRAAAQTAGAGTGTLLVILAGNLPESKWKHLAIGIAPALSVSISSGLVWSRAYLEKRELKKQAQEIQRREEEDFLEAKQTLEAAINKPGVNEARKDVLRKKLENLEDFKLEPVLKKWSSKADEKKPLALDTRVDNQASS